MASDIDPLRKKKHTIRKMTSKIDPMVSYRKDYNLKPYPSGNDLKINPLVSYRKDYKSKTLPSKMTAKLILYGKDFNSKTIPILK